MTQKQISQDIDLDTGLKLVAQAFTELASIKLQRIRHRIERNRIFFDEISEVFGAVAQLADKKGIVPKLEKKGTVALILTSNSKFYGGLERRLLRFYQDSLANYPAERVLIGHSAANFFQSEALRTSEVLRTNGALRTKSIILHQDLPSDSELKQISDLISRYSKVLVFYPRFQSILLQKPFVVDLTHSGLLSKPAKVTIDYILEPELTKMWQFFDGQIQKLLLEQTFLEAELARTAARLTSMDQAQESADKALSTLRKTLAAAKRSLNNRKILDTESSIFRFRRRES